MITPKIKALFQFIEYLHSNINDFNLNNDLIKELELLNEERQKVSSKKIFKDKLKYDEVQAEIETKFKILQGNTANLIKAKARELNVCNFENEPNYSFNGIETDIHQLKENFSKDELPEIFKHKQQYIEYRNQTHKTFLSLAIFIDELDEITKSLFDYFKDTQQNEFEHFETKAIPVNNISEAVQGFKQGQTKFIIPNLLGKTQNRIWEQIADFSFFQIEVVADLEFEGKIYKNVKQRNNDSILTPENWEQYKETFFTQRMATYKDSYTLTEKIKLELSRLEKLPTNKTDYQILKDRYKAYLEQKQALPPQQTLKQKPELKLNEFFIKEVSSDAIEAIQTEFRELEGKDLAILIYLLHKEHQIIEILTNSRTKGRKGFVKCLKETDNPTMQKVNKCFTPNTDDLIYSKDDLVFQSLNKRLTKTIKI